MNKTRKNILANNNLSITIWTKDEQEEGYQFKGEAEYFTKGKWKKMVDEMKENKGLAHKRAVLITVKEIWDIDEPRLICKESQG